MNVEELRSKVDEAFESRSLPSWPSIKIGRNHTESSFVERVVELNWHAVTPRQLNDVSGALHLLSWKAMPFVWGKFMSLTLRETKAMLGNYFASDFALLLSFEPDDKRSLGIWTGFSDLTVAEKEVSISWLDWSEVNYPPFDIATNNLRKQLRQRGEEQVK